MKSILITSYFYYPEINPRAFRTFELAKEFAKNGYKVDVIIPDNNYDYSEFIHKFGINVQTIPSGFFLNKYAKLLTSPKVEKKETIIFKILKYMMGCIYLGGKSFEYAFTLYNHLRISESKYDFIISISVPVSVHLGTSLYLRSKKSNAISLADCGDPFSFNPDLKPKCFYLKYIEKWVLDPFDFIIIPTKTALESYTYFKPEDKIKIIPQSFDTDNIKLKSYNKNTIPTFAYAGIFYKSIRNPKNFFDFLSSLNNINFRFILYTNINNYENMKLIAPYIEILGEKLEIYDLIPREKCIYELSGMDFLINQHNLHEEQKPSKMIDYMLTKRPIFDFNQEYLDENELLKFLMFKNNKEFDLDINKQNFDEYSNQTILKKFEQLFRINK